MKRNPTVKTILCAATALVGACGAQAQLFIDVGNFALLPNTAGQQIEISVENRGLSDILVTGLNFVAQVADTGPASEGGAGSIDGPNITGVDILNGTVFQLNNVGAKDAGSVPQYATWNTETASGTVNLTAGSSTKLATLTISTLGFSSEQDWPLRLGTSAFLGIPTTYVTSLGAEIVPTITEGTLAIVPEPASITAVGLILFGFAALNYRAKRSAS